MDDELQPIASVDIGTFKASIPTTDNSRLVMLIWGKHGHGKTTLAATAPGVKLYLMFDNKGEQPLIGRNDCLIVPLSTQTHSIVERFRQDNPFGILTVLKENPAIETIVVDSLTILSDLALDSAVAKSKNSTLELPGQNGYSARNAIFKRAMTTLIRVAEMSNRHIIFIAHEGSPRMDDNGAISETPPILTESAVTSAAIKMSEIWWLSDDGKQRKIAVRPKATRKFMKSRMWNTSTAQDFTWNYDADNMKGDGIATWFDQWKKGGGRKLTLPK